MISKSSNLVAVHIWTNLHVSAIDFPFQNIFRIHLTIFIGYVLLKLFCSCFVCLDFKKEWNQLSALKLLARAIKRLNNGSQASIYICCFSGNPAAVFQWKKLLTSTSFRLAKRTSLPLEKGAHDFKSSAFKVRVVTELLRRPLYQALFQLSNSGLPSGCLPFNACCHIKSKLDHSVSKVEKTVFSWGISYFFG